jgi:hypothetical protein
VLLGLLAALPTAAAAATPSSANEPPKPPLPAVAVGWNSPAVPGLWARAEAPQRDAEDPAVHGLVAIGHRMPVLSCEVGGLWCDGLNLTTMPVLRGVPDAPERDGGLAPALGAALLQEASLNFGPALKLRASAAMGDRLGVGAPLVAGSGVAMRASAGVAADLSAVVPLNLDLSFAYAQDLSNNPAGPQPNDCEAVLRLSWLGRSGRHAPLSLAMPCGDRGFGHAITFGLRGQF